MINGVLERIRKIYDEWTNKDKRTVREVSRATGIPKSSVYRHMQTIEKRNRYPESKLWETEEGYSWLCMLVCAAIYEFGIKHSVGARSLSDFFKRIKIDSHIGVSSTVLYRKISYMEELIIKYQKEFEKQQSEVSIKTILAGDETFFDNLLLLVLMDLPSGYIFIEESVENRTFESWRKSVENRFSNMTIEVVHAITDRARALIKLSLEWFKCQSGADLFHIMRDIHRSLGSNLSKCLKQSNSSLEKYIKELKKCVEKKSCDEKIKKYHKLIDKANTMNTKIKQGVSTFKETILSISEKVHPFSIENNNAQDSAKVEEILEEKAKTLEEIANNSAIVDSKSGINSFRKQIKELTSIIDVWWLWVVGSLMEYELEQDKQHWLMYYLLPTVYWHKQMIRAQNIAHKEKYKKAWKKSSGVCKAHPATSEIHSEELKRWYEWAEWITWKFHRSSSAVEGV